MSSNLLLLGLAALVLGGFALFFLARLVYWYREGLKLKVSGYMPPPSSRFARGSFKSICRVITRVFVGPLTVYGRENAVYKGRGLVLPNHVFFWDFAVYAAAIPFAYRQIAKYAEIAFAPIRTWAAFIGTVGVQVEEGKTKDGAGQAIVSTGAKVLASSSGSRMLMAIQGRLIHSGKVLPKDFRTGARRILAETRLLVGDDPLFAQPVAIYYLRDKVHATRLQRILYPLGLGLLRTVRWKEKSVGADGVEKVTKYKATIYGVIVVIGKPIPQADIPAEARAGTEYLRVVIEGMLQEVEAGLEFHL